ncbi:MAG: ATP-binding protein [Oscillospiraceae bacterium]|nr:ATP-binding protein [Oscillospiraceae bacterium]
MNGFNKYVQKGQGIEMKKLPVGIQNFRKIIEGSYAYADKTQHVYNLLNDASYYFLSRPRRFGKSLLLDTIAEAFGGDRELFKGLFIFDSDYDFEKYPDLHDEILAWYDGYSWDGQSRVINPFSILNFFSAEKFSSFWYASGTPKFLLDLIKQRPRGYTDLKNLEMGEWTLDTFDLERMEVEPLLFQTGYLTVKEVLPNQRPPVYLLDVPNYEVRIAFNLHILAAFTESGATYAETSQRIRAALNEGNLEALLGTLRGLFASIPYEIHIGKEAYYHSIFYAIMNLLGFEVDAEVSVSGGRIGATLELEDKAYVFEFKYAECPPDACAEAKCEIFDKTLKAGMKQLEDRGYAKKYEGGGKIVYQAAFAFLGRDDIEMVAEKLVRHA